MTPEKMHYVSSISAIDGMEGHKFELFCAELLRKNGFLEVTVTPGSGDQGVDILAVKDGVKYAVQCKNYASTLDNTPVQEVSAGKQFYGCHVGVVMTNSTFTSGAVQLAAATNVLLWDRKKLDELILNAGGLENLGIHMNYANYDADGESFECGFYGNGIETINTYSNAKLFSILAYLGILWIVGLLAAKDDVFVKYHVNQGLLLFLLGVAGSIVGIIPIIGAIVGAIVSVVCFVLMILGIVNAVKGEMKPLPFIGNFELIK